MIRPLAAAALGALLAFAAHPVRAEIVAITGGDVYPVSGPHLPGASVVIEDGRILAVGRSVAIPAGARRIDARGRIVTPGFINAQTQLGLIEIGAERGTRNDTARGSIAAAFRPWDGFFSGSAYIAATREDGVTTVGIEPSGGFIAGQAAAMHLVDGLASQMVLRAPVAVVATVAVSSRAGENDERIDTAGAPPGGTGDDAPPPMSHGEAFGVLRTLLDDARTLAAHRRSYDDGRLRALGASAGSLAALLPVVRGSEPLWIQADRADDIDGVLRLARAERIRVVVVGGAEAWRVAGELAAAHVPVMTGAMNNIPDTFDTLGQRQENAALLRRAGVQVALIGNGGGFEDGFNARNIRFEAGNAVAFGMSRDDALRAVTLEPALLLGVGDRVGALRPGMSADVVVWSGDPFEFASTPEHVFVAGREYHDASRQDRLIERYRHLPRDNAVR